MFSNRCLGFAGLAIGLNFGLFVMLPRLLSRSGQPEDLIVPGNLPVWLVPAARVAGWRLTPNLAEMV